MVLVDIDSVTITRPERDLFREVSVTVAERDRLGIVGINGTGKSTLLRVMAGTADVESGTVRRGRDTSVAVLDQQAALPPGTVRDAIGDSWESESIIDRLGMTPHLDTPTSQLSGGEAKRVALALALVTPADLLILDEPTNHLDIEAIEWLEKRLDALAGALVIVTHDRHLLDRVTTRVLELDRGTAYLYDGGYQGYLDGRAVREEQAARAENTRRNLARRELAWLRRGALARTTKAKARVDRAEAIVEAGPAAAAREGRLDLHMGTPRLGDRVIELEGVSFGFTPDRPLLTNVDLQLGRRERLGVVGMNGSGKSTLLGIIAGRIEPTAGSRVVGSTVQLAEHRQLGPDLDPEVRVIHAVTGGREPTWRDKALLEKFWFDSDVQRSPVRLLSGGERRRLELVLVLLDGPNVLLLDEPTNDLDLDTLRSLEDFLDDWPGALVVVSHDRAFLERTVDDVVVVDSGRVGRIPGGYRAWEASRLRPERRSPNSASRPAVSDRTTGAPLDAPTGGRRSRSTLLHLVKQTERELASLEKLRAPLVAALDQTTDHVELADLGGRLGDIQTRIDAVEATWLELQDELESR
ncbi:MAG: ATP-binding cassette domain-containing protein [Acidimicrobiia bacterium]|nr:ATP-binding cassette domain-containing protein [Acidimicrobiia bacterium]